MKKKLTLEQGFIFLSDWTVARDKLPPKEFGLLMGALIDRQFRNRPMPTFHNPLTDAFARMIEPVILRRLEGAAYAKRNADEEEPPTGGPPSPKEEKRKEKNRTDEYISAEQSGAEEVAAGAADSVPSGAHRAPSKKKGKAETDENIPTAYLEQRQLRAIEYARKSGQDVLAVLSAWWKQDKAAFLAAQREEADTNDTSAYWEDFFEAAVARSGTSQA